MKSLRHLAPLDGLRGCAALLVMVHHWFQAFTAPLGVAEEFTPIPTANAPAWLSSLEGQPWLLHDVL